MLHISKASLLMGLCETFIASDYKIVDGFFGNTRFARDKRYKCFALCGTNNEYYGIVGGNEFVLYVLERINYKPSKVKIALCNSHLAVNPKLEVTIYTKYNPLSIDYINNDC